MTTTINWQIDNAEHDVATGCITVLHWRVNATDGEHNASIYGAVALEPKDPSDPTFVSYADVTADQAVEWAKAKIGADEVAAAEAALKANLANQASPKTATGLPWAK